MPSIILLVGSIYFKVIYKACIQWCASNAMQLDIKISLMMPMLICHLYSNLVGMSVQLFTALSEQLVMSCLPIFPKMAFPVLVSKYIFYFFSITHGFD